MKVTKPQSMDIGGPGPSTTSMGHAWNAANNKWVLGLWIVYSCIYAKVESSHNCSLPKKSWVVWLSCMYPKDTCKPKNEDTQGCHVWSRSHPSNCSARKPHVERYWREQPRFFHLKELFCQPMAFPCIPVHFWAWILQLLNWNCLVLSVITDSAVLSLNDARSASQQVCSQLKSNQPFESLRQILTLSKLFRYS